MNYTLLTSEFKNFKEVLGISRALLQDVTPGKFSSPYSTLLIISQILGLNTPLMGSGDSPYSITSVIFDLKDKKTLFKKAFSFPLVEKRMILDEFYEMIPPLLLDEKEFYIDLLAKTKFKRELKDSIQIREFKRTMRNKFNLLGPFVKQFLNHRVDFGYIVHYGYPSDLFREYSYLEKMPEALASQWRQYSYPAVNEITIRNFPDSGAGTKKEIKGLILFIPNYTKELLEDGKLRKRKILQAASLAQKLGSKIIGMGGLIASFAQGGHWLSEQIPGVGFTTGHAYTIANITEIMQKSADKVGLDIKRSTAAIVGSAGSIGSGCAKLLAEKRPEKIILVDLSTFSARQKLEELRGMLLKKSPETDIELSGRLADIKKADIIIMATNSPTSIIKSEYLKKGAIIIDDAFPKNVSKDLLKKRKDIILLEGGITQLPKNIDIFFSRNMPDLMDVPLTKAVSCKETYGCFAEILVLALYNYRKNYGLGNSDPVLAKDILSKAKRIGFTTAPFQCFDEAVERERFTLALKEKRLHGNQRANLN